MLAFTQRANYFFISYSAKPFGLIWLGDDPNEQHLKILLALLSLTMGKTYSLLCKAGASKTKETHTRATEVSWGVCMLQYPHCLSPLKTSSLQVSLNEPSNTFDGLSVQSARVKVYLFDYDDINNLKKNAV